MSLYREIGGEQAIQTALDRFYEKVLVDPRLSGFFEGLDVERVKRRQKAFLTMAFGGPNHYDGRDLRTAHRRAVERGLTEVVYEVFMGHFRTTLEELDVPRPKIQQIMEIAEGGRHDVLNR
jgi:hemoglobin